MLTKRSLQLAAMLALSALAEQKRQDEIERRKQLPVPKL